MFRTILIAGYGAMTGAMLEGWLASGMPPGTFTLYGPRAKPAPAGVRFVTEPPGGVLDALVLGFKPQVLAEATKPLGPLAGPDTTVVSVLAGVDLASLRRRFPHAGAIVRMMPNLAAALGKSATALVGEGLAPAQHAAVNDLAARLGTAEWLADERRFDLVAALAGSGPAFVYRFVDALAEGAARLGLDREQAERLALATVEGAAALAAGSPLAPGALANKVASPGGMTERGLAVLDADEALVRLIEQTLRAARDRGAEMAAAARTDG
ncbi:MAG: pyrroline-5-carboxylate reductase family protein [Cypionkella sp.]